MLRNLALPKAAKSPHSWFLEFSVFRQAWLPLPMLPHTGYSTLACWHAAFADIAAREIAMLVFALWACSQCQMTYKHLKCILRPGMG